MFRNVLIGFALFLLCFSCTPMNHEDTKAAAPGVWAKQGFTVVSYEGYQWGKFGPFGYGGAEVWHRLERKGFLYSGYIQKWGDEYHVYGPDPLGPQVEFRQGVN